MRDLYPSKLMLFGEYAVIAGGEGFAIPWDDFVLVWVEESNTPSDYHPHLMRFAAWLSENGFGAELDTEKFALDLQQGLDVASNIPIGYGVGSSGAVVAAVYDRYAFQKIPLTELARLKDMLASMENFFHATSSGLDPLVCYVQQPIHITPDEIIMLNTPVDWKPLTMHLLDCGNERSTQHLVTQFKSRMQDADMQLAMRDYVQYSNACIHALLAGDTDALKKNLHALSQWQFTYFDFAIPQHLREEWQQANTFESCFYKLCGAGGGGFMLVFS